jgi:hypothetical protein
MEKILKRLLAGILFAFIALFVTSNFSYPLIMGNFSENSFVNPDVESTPLNTHIVNGAGFFLKSYSDTLLLLNRIETADINGIDYNELEILVSSAIENMHRSKEAYANLKQLADRTPYNQVMIAKLLSFDYNGFKHDKGFNPIVLKQVESYLGRGDVRGFYGHLLSATIDISTRLNTIKASIDAASLPKIETLWRINQEFSETMLFGQYAANVFKNFSI